MSDISEDNVGMFFLDSSGVLWMLQSYCKHPTATMKNVVTGQLLGGAVDSPNLSDFQLAEIKPKGENRDKETT